MSTERDADRSQTPEAERALEAYGKRLGSSLRAADERRFGSSGREGEPLAERLLHALGEESPPRPSALSLVWRSPLLRLLAASLLAHLVALPVLAWYTFRPAPGPTIHLRIEPAEPVELPAFEEDHGPLGAATDGVWELEERRRVQRHRLASLRRLGGELGLGARGATDGEVPWMRAQALREAVWLAADRQEMEELRGRLAALDRVDGAEPLAAALLAAAELDLCLRLGLEPAECPELLARMERLEDSALAVAAATLQRARALGFGPPRLEWDPNLDPEVERRLLESDLRRLGR